MARNRIIPIFVPHLGCPHQCVFCNQRRIAGVGTSLRPCDVSAAIAAGLQRSGGGAEVAFYGGSFTAIPSSQQEALLGAVQPFLDDGRVSAIRLSTRPDAINGETLERLRRFRVQTVELGSQSTSDAVLALCGRGHTSEDTVQAAGLLRAAEFHVVLQMMTGLPGSSPACDLETARRLIGLKPDGVRIYPTVVVRDTPLFDRYEAGQYRPQTVEEAAILCAKLYRMFTAEGIPVLRMGLQPTETLSRGGAVAGPYHPAFGELVKSRILYENACQLLDRTDGADVTLLVRKDKISAMAGQKRSNLEALRRRYPEKRLKVAAGPCGEWEILLQSVKKPDKIT